MKQYVRFIVSMLIISLLFVGCGNDSSKEAGKASTSEKITVSAAASLKDALTELADIYKQEHHLQDDQIALNFAGSGTLRQQIEQGAPVSLFISADQKHMRFLEEKAFVTEVKPFVTNSLVLVVPKGKEVVTLEQLGTVNRVVLGEPATVPAGNYGQQVLMNMGIWNSMEHKIVCAKDVKAVTAVISQGAGDAGFVYKTDAMAASESVQIAVEIPDSSHEPIIYPIGIVKKYDSPLTKDFYQFLRTPEAQKVLVKYGFTGTSK